MSPTDHNRGMKAKVSFSTCLFGILVFLFFQYLFLVSRIPALKHKENFKEDEKLLRKSFYPNSGSHHLNDESNVLIPKDKFGNKLSLEERVRYLELKLNSYMHFSSDPFFGVKVDNTICQSKLSTLVEYGCKPGLDGIKNEEMVKDNCPGLFDNDICIDKLPKPIIDQNVDDVSKLKVNDNSQEKNRNCLVYDFGIRAQPQFGSTLARVFGCEVHAFDPSPVSTDWWNSDDAKKLRELPNYHFHPYGTGGIDGSIILKEYNWGQVSILRYPSQTLDCKEDKPNCKSLHHTSKSFRLPVKTLPTIIKELGHEGRTIDIMKIDVEGSEYSFLENLMDMSGGCPDYIDQLTLEWHHYPFDPRYGEGASPPINTLSTLLHACGLKNIYTHSQSGWRSNEKIYVDLDMKDVRYNIVTFYRGESKAKN